MTIFGIATLGLMAVSALLGLIILVWKITGAKKLHNFMFYCFCAFILTLMGACGTGVTWVIQIIDYRKVDIRQTKEREQIMYQIDNMTTSTDKVKLNEWILSYNDWVNDINSGKETWGIFDWYYNFDMSGHEIIQLV